MTLEDFFLLEDEREIIRAFYSMKERRKVADQIAQRSSDLRELAKTAYTQTKAAGARFRARADELDRLARVLNGQNPYQDETTWEAERLAADQPTTED